ncbi:MAG: FeoB-associated Cys-rich membrane protein [Firmicutes bacterium]|nr:FeoB-associated Cys-rich membrane protein [Bacillota bacterium]
MLAWLQTNLGSVVVVLILLSIVSLIIRKLILDKKAGKHICGGSCGGGCAGCPMQGKCNSK